MNGEINPNERTKTMAEEKVRIWGLGEMEEIVNRAVEENLIESAIEIFTSPAFYHTIGIRETVRRFGINDIPLGAEGWHVAEEIPMEKD